MLLFELDDLTAKNVAYNETLNPKLYDVNGNMRPEVRESLLRVANNFITDLDIPELVIEDIILTGSSANYNYTKYSDIDLHLVADIDILSEPELAAKYFKAAKNVWNNNHNVEVYGMDVEVYVESADEVNQSLGRFSVQDNKWITKPVHNQPTYDNAAINRKVRYLEREIDDLVTGGYQDKEEYTRLKRKIWDMRQAGLDAGGEYNTENLAFKVLRNMGKLNNLIDAERDAEDREMSVTN